jgi:cytochrome c nitrite reductase small subunit
MSWHASGTFCLVKRGEWMSRWMVLVVVLCATVGAGLGLMAFTFVYAKGQSYLSNDSKACANCHVMSDQYDQWTRSSHKAVAQCNDCHTPHDVVGKYMTKASNGFWHSFAFTTQEYPDNIRIKPSNLRIAEQACRSCHADIVDQTNMAHDDTEERTCVSCHQNVGH